MSEPKKSNALKPPTAPPQWDTVTWPATCLRVLAIDQSLVNSGWVLIDTGFGRPPHVLDYGTIHTRPQDGLRGYADSFARGDQLFGAFRALLMHTTPEFVVTEMPAMQGKVASRNREAPLVATVAIRSAALSLGYRGRLGMMQAQHVKKWLTGSGNALKPVVRTQVQSVIAFEGRINEHVADAAALVIAAMLDGTIDQMAAQVAQEPASVGVVR